MTIHRSQDIVREIIDSLVVDVVFDF
jgi:hypothetical protein